MPSTPNAIGLVLAIKSSLLRNTLMPVKQANNVEEDPDSYRDPQWQAKSLILSPTQRPLRKTLLKTGTFIIPDSEKKPPAIDEDSGGSAKGIVL
ncbi:hypothetical protein [Phnomibacter sp. MR]|uniref:hypothetical protein n=1 Tax=Phnomibacter sp. MR TaxID=3042318 RepID=UPI003A7F9F80